MRTAAGSCGRVFVCHHCGRNCRLCTVVWSRFICRADENAFFQLCLKNPGADDLDYGLSGSFKRLFSGTGTMVPTAVSQILEQIVNAVVSVVAAGLCFRQEQL